MIQNHLFKKTSFAPSFAMDITPEMWQLISDIKSSQLTGAVASLTLQSLGLELIAAQLHQIQHADNRKVDGFKKDDIEKLKQIKEYLDNHFLTEMSLLHLSRVSLLNEFKLKKGFKSLYGNTVFGYVRELKMKHAAVLLRNSMSVAEVADELGYEHPHHFSIAFKNYMGVTPTLFQGKKV